MKAAMLSRLRKGCCLHEDELSESILNDGVIDVDNLNMDDVRRDYEKVFGTVGWLDGPKARSLAKASLYSSRYIARDRYHLVINIMKQALVYGPDYVLGRVSREARTFFNRARRVCIEISRACGFIRLEPAECPAGCVMAGRVEFTNDISDIVLRKLSRRSKNAPVYLVEKDTAYFLSGRKTASCHVRDLPFDLPDGGFSEFWEAYYDSQFIEGRKNLSLARKHLPQKCWSWVPEGKKLR